jgi:hypothetical protein
MDVRAFRARVRCDRKTLDDLWRTHVLYNDTVQSLLVKCLRCCGVSVSPVIGIPSAAEIIAGYPPWLIS